MSPQGLSTVTSPSGRTREPPVPQMTANRLKIKDVAEQSGVAAGTIRMWEKRHGFPRPQRTASGYRLYSEADVEALRRVQAYRHRGLSVAAAIDRAVLRGNGSDRPSIYAAVSSLPEVKPQVLRKSTLMAISRAIEHEALARAAAPVLVGAFQHEPFYRAVEPRYRELSARADAAVVFADFSEERHPDGGPVEIPVAPEDALGNEWAVVVDAPGYAACLLAWEQPGVTEPEEDPDLDRRFEAIWTLDPVATRRAAEAGAALAGRVDPDLGREIDGLLAGRPLAIEEPAPSLTALTNRLVAYMEAS